MFHNEIKMVYGDFLAGKQMYYTVYDVIIAEF